MTEETIFNTPADQQEPATPVVENKPKEQEPNQLDQLLQGIVTEDGKPKYRSAEDALIALKNSQEHIKRLEAENAEFRTKTIKSETTEEILAALRERGGEQAPTVDLSKEVTDIVLRTLSANEQQKAMKANTSIVINAVTKAYGDKSEALFYGKAEELGFDRAEINRLSAKNPSAVLKLLGITETTKPTVNPPGVRSDGFQQQEEKPKSAMGFGSTKDLTNAWQASKAATAKRLGIQ